MPDRDLATQISRLAASGRAKIDRIDCGTCDFPIFGANHCEKYETDANLFVKLTTGSDQSIAKFQIKSIEQARGARTEKRETLFSKQRWLDVIFGVF